MTNVERLRGCVTASRGIDCRDPDLLLEAAAEIERLTAESERRKAALEACVEFWSDTDIPCPIALHDKVTDAIGAFQQDPKP